MWLFCALDNSRPRPTHGIDQVAQVATAIQVADQFLYHRFLALRWAAHGVQVEIQLHAVMRQVLVDVGAQQRLLLRREVFCDCLAQAAGIYGRRGLRCGADALGYCGDGLLRGLAGSFLE